MPLSLSQYLQISDSAFPTGAFAYSSGLEALARAGRFPSLKALEDYLDAHLSQAGEYDLAFVAAAHFSESSASGDEQANCAGFTMLCAEWDAAQWNTAMRTASLRQARALIDALCETFPHKAEEGLAKLRGESARADGMLHFTPALGRALAVLGASREQACTLYLHGLVRDQAAAAVRLGIVGPRAAQTLQARAMRRATERLGDGSGLPAPCDARRTAPLVEVGQGGHGFMYSRLYQN
jgi:urease accessory protein